PVYEAGYADRGLAAGSSSGTPWTWCLRRPTFRLLARYYNVASPDGMPSGTALCRLELFPV
ncbi:MAG: hypothetical protein J3T61_09725, partial [Candidatus Brocadiales bacterium]|nr:hypothetical protein [Candidatus Bathyanammoxibius sp.]